MHEVFQPSRSTTPKTTRWSPYRLPAVSSPRTSPEPSTMPTEMVPTTKPKALITTMTESLMTEKSIRIQTVTASVTRMMLRELPKTSPNRNRPLPPKKSWLSRNVTSLSLLNRRLRLRKSAQLQKLQWTTVRSTFRRTHKISEKVTRSPRKMESMLRTIL